MADVDKVRTPAGVKRYGAPIGTPIVRKGRIAKMRAAIARLDGGGTSSNPKPKSPTPETPDIPKPKDGRTARAALKAAKSRISITEHRKSVADRKTKAQLSLERDRIVRGPGPWDPADGYERRGLWVDEQIGKALDAGEATDALYKREKYLPGGKKVEFYVPERDALHEKIIDELWKRGGGDTVPRERKALFTGGAGGSGKGTVLKAANIKEGEDYVTVNADEVKELMAEWGLIPAPEGISPMEAVALVHEESSDISTKMAARLQREGVNMIWDITMSGPGQVHKRIAALKENGYEDIRGMYVDVPLEVSVSSAKSRYANGMNRLKDADGSNPKHLWGGRRVPPHVIMKSASDTPGVTKNKLAFESVRNEFTVAEVWDNNRFDKDGGRLPPMKTG